MGIIATAVKHMLAAGLDEDAIVSAIAEMEANASPAKSARQERNRRYYEKKASEKRLKASEQDDSDVSDASKTPLARVDVKSQNTDENSSSRKISPKGDVVAFKAELSDLDSERLEAIIKHRRTKKGQLTAHAARLFRGDAEACGLSMAEAVDTCISRNWITVKPDWLSKPQARGSPPSHTPSQADVFAMIGKRLENGQADEDSYGARAPVSYLPAARSG